MINPPVNPPPPPERDSPPENPTYSNPDPPWAAVEEKLLAIGLYHAGSVCLQAREQGVKPFFVRAIIEYWEANKDLWGLGALTERIRRARPDQDVGRHWPPADPKGLEVRSRFESLSARERQQAQEREREVQANERRKREAELVEQLERDVGPILDGLSDQERGALETRAFDPIELQILARGQPLFGYREKLLKRLDHERQENARSPDVDCGEPGVAG